MENKVIVVKSVEDTIKIQEILVEIIKELKNGKSFDVVIKRHRNKRSKNANDYSWALQNEIAKALNKSISEVHKQMVLDYGVLETYSIVKEAFESAKRIFDYFEILGESSVGNKTFIHVKAGIGTHAYDTKEMSVFIDGVIQEAKSLGIETKTPNEIKEMKSLWEKGER